MSSTRGKSVQGVPLIYTYTQQETKIITINHYELQEK